MQGIIPCPISTPCFPLITAPSSCTQLQLPLRAELSPWCLHQGGQSLLWSPGQSLSPQTQSSCQSLLCGVMAWCLAEEKQAGIYSLAVGLCQLPLLQNLTGFGLDGSTGNGAPSTVRVCL